MTIGERVKNLREMQGLTQEELAKKLGYKSKSSVAHIENGRDIPRSMVVKLATVLNSTPAYLMGWEEKNARAEVLNKVNELSDDKIDKLLSTHFFTMFFPVFYHFFSNLPS